MSFRRLLPALAILLLGLAVLPAHADSPVAAGDEEVLKSIGLTADGSSLLEFFKRRCDAKVTKEQVTALAKELADKDATKRSKAMAELAGYGPPAVPLLRQAANELDNAEAATVAKKLLTTLDGVSGASVTATAVRTLAALKPAGAAEVLINYLPSAEDESVIEEINSALTAVALKDGKPDPALVKALEDEAPARRAAAAEVLARVGGDDVRPAVRKLLKDAKPNVRMRTALVLAQFNDPESVPVLIALMNDLSQEQARPIEDFMTNLAGDWNIVLPQGNDTVSKKLRRDLWLAWWNAADGPTLVEELKKRSPSDADREKIQGLIKKLGAADTTTRDKALADLSAMGTPAVPFLRQATNAADPRLVEHAQKCLGLIDQTNFAPLPAAAARLLAIRRPDGAAEAILNYLPSADDDSILAELRTCLTSLALKDGKADPALVKALEDKEPIRRSAAAESLGQAGAMDVYATVRKLLKDGDPHVKAAAALALAGARDKESFPEVIGLIASLPAPQAGQIDERLRALVGEKSPDVTIGDDDASRKKASEVWGDWWKKNGEKVELVRLDQQFSTATLGYTLITEINSVKGGMGRVFEVDRAGKIRWAIEGLQGPTDAKVIPGNHVLIAEHNLNRVSERDMKGKILWEKPMNQPVTVQRLPNGNTFMVGRGQITELDRAGKTVMNFTRNNFDIVCGTKLKNGEIAYSTQNGQAFKLDANGKELRTLKGGGGNTYYYGSADFLPNDRWLFPSWNANKVTEYDKDGKVLWEATVNRPSSVRRLPNGNTLVSTITPWKVVELDRAGKVVWESKENAQAIRAERR
jgi:HEAT repeat protein